MDALVQSYFVMVARYWKLLAAIALIPTLVVLILVQFVMRPVYEGSTSVIFPLKRASTFMRRSLTEMEIPVASMSGLLETAPTLYNHIAIIESRSLALRVSEFLLEEKGIDLLASYPDIGRDRDLSDERKQRALARRMRKRVNVDDADRGLALVTFAHHDAEIAAATANAYISQTLELLNEINRSTQSDLVLFLEVRQREVGERLETAEGEIQTAKEETGILSVEENARALIASYADIEAIVAQAEIDYRGGLTQAGEMSRAGMDMQDYYEWLASGNEPEEGGPVPAIDALADQTIAQLRSELNDLELGRQQAMLWATPENPEVLALGYEIEAVRRELYREFSGYYDAAVASLLVESSAYQAQLDVAQGILVELDMRLDTFPPEERRLIELERERDVQESIYLVITQELVQARIQERRDEEPFTVLDEALVPTKPVRPRKVFLTLGTFFLSFWVGVFVIFMVDADRRRRAAVGPARRSFTVGGG